MEQLAKQHSHLENMVRKEIEVEPASSAQGSQAVCMPGMTTTASASTAAMAVEAAAYDDQTRAKSPTSGGTNSDDDELFEDARDDNEICFHIPVPPTHRRTSRYYS